jgi:5-methylcytosine-specific restriction endonuclease McrA
MSESAPSTPAPVEEFAVKRTAPGLSNHLLERQLDTVVANEDTATAIVLDSVAEYDARKLYRAAGYSSMFMYCVRKLRRSEPAAYHRIRAACAAQRFPAIFDAVAEARLSLSAVVLLAPHLTEDTAQDLISAGTHKTLAEIKQLLAERFPRPDVPTSILPIPALSPAVPITLVPGDQDVELSLNSVGMTIPERIELTSRSVPVPAVPAVEDRWTVKPLSPGRFDLRCTIDQETQDALRRAQDLLGHELPSGDVPQVLKRALLALNEQLDKRRSSATVRPRRRTGCRSEDPRSVPADVQRAVWQRDGDQCTFVSADGHRCEERRFVELDHVDPVARGGEATVANLRVLCRAHNQYEAERAFGAEFMRHKRIAAAEARAESKVAAGP